MKTMSLLDFKIKLTPKEFSHFLINKGDIFWSEYEKFWVVTSYESAKLVLGSDDFTADRSPFFLNTLSSTEISLAKDFFDVINKMMVMSDPPEHTSRRRICYDGFTNQTLEALQPLIIKTIQQQLLLCRNKDHIELVEDLARIVPSSVLADFFDIPEKERPLFYECSNHMTQFFGGSKEVSPESAMEVNNSAIQLRDYFKTLIQKRKSAPKNDFLSTLLKNQAAFQLTENEIISQAVMMLVAGQVTTSDQLCNNVYTLLSSGESLAILEPNKISIDEIIHELNRLDPAVNFIFRIAKNDTTIQDQTIKKNDILFISSHAVNRDPRVFMQPDECNFLRQKNNHLSYGFGRHYCIGAKLAQLEMKNCLQLLLNAFPNIRFDENDLPRRKHHSLGFSGFERMVLKKI